jgi:hypothetical protein
MDKILRSGRGGHDLLGFLQSFLLLSLALVGMAGVIYQTISPGGMIASVLGRVLSDHPVLSCLVLIGLVTMILAARGQVERKRFNRGGNETPLYIFVALGTFFAARILVYGTL